MSEKVGFDIFPVLYEFHNLVECLCAAAYMQIEQPVKIVEITDSTGWMIRERFVIPLNDPAEIAEIEERIAKEVLATHFIEKSSEYYQKTNIEPLDAVVWLHFNQGYGIRPKTQRERDIVNLEGISNA